MHSPVLARIGAALAAAALTACSTVAATDAQPPTRPAQHATLGGDGSPIQLSPLTSEDIDAAKLTGELGCSFAAGDDALLVAMGVVASKEPAIGVLKVGDSVEAISSPGGFDGMLRGATFVGRGKAVIVERTASQPLGGGESPPYPARLTYQRADGASRSFEGLWTCGP